MYSFFITIHAQPPGAARGDPIELAGRSIHPLRIVPEELATTTFPCSFESAIERLAALGQMYCEPDGSFVWVSRHGEPAWQVDGNLYDRDEKLLFVDLKGKCPAERFDHLLAAFGWPTTKLMFQLTREAAFLDEAEFRRFAEDRG
jgi:hypothetical protein